jgi:hypothetical protein
LRNIIAKDTPTVSFTSHRQVFVVLGKTDFTHLIILSLLLSFIFIALSDFAANLHHNLNCGTHFDIFAPFRRYKQELLMLILGK